jgi:hypothetical protein
MNNSSLENMGLGCGDVEGFSKTYLALKEKFDIQLTGNIDFNLGQFEIFNHYLGFHVRDSYVIKHLNCDSYILFIETRLKNMGKGSFGGYTDCQTWAICYLKHDFGRVLIRRETLTDKILELVHPIELDFTDDKAFSDTFYVLVNDHIKANRAIDRNFRNAVMDIREDDFVIEIVEHTLVIGDRKPISPERAIYLAEFVSRVASLC